MGFKAERGYVEYVADNEQIHRIPTTQRFRCLSCGGNGVRDDRRVRCLGCGRVEYIIPIKEKS